MIELSRMAQHHQIEAETPRLGAFLRGDRPIALSAAERSRRIHQLFLGDLPAMPAPETHGARTMVMWRIVRATATAKGLLAEDETLDEATETLPSPWTCPWKSDPRAGLTSALRRGRASELCRLHDQGEGLPLLPPRDDSVVRWVEAATLVADDLRITSTPMGMDGLLGIADVRLASRCDVTSAQVLALEELMIDECMTLLVECSERAAVTHFREEYGLTRKEALGLVRLSRAEAVTSAASSIEEDRAVMASQLKDLVAREKEQLNTTGELRALKELARVQGLTRTDPVDTAAEFRFVIAKTAREQDALPPPTIDMIPVKVASAVEATVPTEETEALAEFDVENRRRP